MNKSNKSMNKKMMNNRNNKMIQKISNKFKKMNK